MDSKEVSQYNHSGKSNYSENLDIGSSPIDYHNNEASVENIKGSLKKYFNASQHRRYQRKKAQLKKQLQLVEQNTPEKLSYPEDLQNSEEKSLCPESSCGGINKINSLKKRSRLNITVAHSDKSNRVEKILKCDLSQNLPLPTLECEVINRDIKSIENHQIEEERKLNLNKMDTKVPENSREEIKAEREAKKLAKQMAKNKTKTKVENANIENKMSNLNLTEPKKENLPKKSVSTDEKEKEPSRKVDIIVQPVKNIPSYQNVLNQNENQKSKSELKAERRAKQEAQRAAKELLQATKSSTNTSTSDKKNLEVPSIENPKSNSQLTVDIKKSQSPEKTKHKLIQSQHKVKLFNHLYGERETAYMVPSIPLNSKEIHPAIVRLGVQYASHIVMGSNARCIALLNALKQVIIDYTLPPNVEFSRGLEAHLAPCIKFLKSCRPPAVSMNNALKHIKWQLTQLPNTITKYDAEAKLLEAIDTYVKEQIEVAGQAISIAVRNKISNGDVILTYGCSSLVEKIISEAAVEKQFRVVVVAAHPWNEGREMLRRLTSKGVKCSLIMISALSFVMREINKVILGAGALLANGYVMARAGTAQVAMVAHAFNVPVLVCCETHKFSERVQTDSFVYNEIGNPDDLIKCNPSHEESPLSNWRTFKSLTLLNLTYDVTPPDLVTAVVTELAILPCTSVPVILRIKPSEFGM